MTDPDTVASALARLATGDPPRRRPRTDGREPAAVVTDAEAAMEGLTDAASFVDDGEPGLRRAVRDAEAAGDDDIVARGRAVLATLAAFRDAAADGERSGDRRQTSESAERPASDGRTTSTPLAQRSSRERS